MTHPYSRWDIVKVPFPFTEGSGDKRRPALIVSAEMLSKEHRLYWLVMITSVVDPKWAGDIEIKDFVKAGLPVRSIIRTAKIATLQEDRILGRLGHLDRKESQQVVAQLDKWLER
jgi:mRNA interferase MazF